AGPNGQPQRLARRRVRARAGRRKRQTAGGQTDEGGQKIAQRLAPCAPSPATVQAPATDTGSERPAHPVDIQSFFARSAVNIGPGLPPSEAASAVQELKAAHPMKTTRREILVLAASLAFAARPAGAQPESEPKDRTAAEPDPSAFDQVWELVRDRFYDPRLNGLDWQAMRERYRPQAEAARSREELSGAINAMLATLGASHTRYYTVDEPAYFQLADIFLGALQHRGQHVFPNGDVAYPGIGVFTQPDDRGRTFISGVIEGAAAHQAGLLLGDEIVAADDGPFHPVGSFRGKVGAKVLLSIRRTRDGTPMSIPVTPVDLHPGVMFLHGLQASARIITAGANARIGYVHVWSYAGRQYQGALEDLIGDGPLKDADGLIWDLRDGWGGAQPQYLDLFNPHSPTMKV